MGYSWWGFKELDMTEQLTHIHTHTHTHTHISETGKATSSNSAYIITTAL